MDQNRLFILALIFLISISVTNSFPTREFRRSEDGCANIKQAYLDAYNLRKDPDIKYADVKNCYYTFLYDSTKATELINTFKGLYGNFYVFLDQAKESPQPGFDYEPVDLLDEFDLLLKNYYRTDFEFTNDINSILNKLKDAHVSFLPTCYSIFSFDQGFYLNSIVKSDGTQVIQVLYDTLNLTTGTCEVTRINGRPAMDVITEFAKTNVQYSRDLGVRFNQALGIPDGVSIKSLFSSRSTLPETETVSYDIVCSGNKLHLEIPWKISISNNSFYEQFSDSSSYFTNICANPDKEYQNTIGDSVKKNDPPSSISELLWNTSNIVYFYQLNETGVVVVSSFEFDEIDYPAVTESIVYGFDQLAKANVTKLVLDFTDNGGGNTDLSAFLNSLLFNNDITIFPYDIRVTEITELVIDVATTNNVSGTYFNALDEIDITNGKHFSTLEEFIGNNFYERGGKEVRFTNKFLDANEVGIKNKKLRWNPSDMIILTNGNCGSSCATTVLYLSEIGQVATVAVGGFYNQPLSFASFAGGSVADTNSLISQLQYIGLNSTTNPGIPSFYNVKVQGAQFPYRESYSIIKPDEVLEFQFRPALHRLYYDEENSRDRTKLWLQAADFIKNS